MTGRGPARRARRGARGTTLIELLVTLALLATGFVALLTAFAQTELAVTSTQEDAQLASAARTVSDVLQAARPGACLPKSQYDKNNCQGAVPYACGAHGLSSSYTTWILGALVQRGLTLPRGVAVASVSVVQATSSSDPNVNPGCSGDLGVQQLHVQLTYAGHTLMRIVYKRWN